MIPYTLTPHGITFIIGKPYTIFSENINFEEIKNAVMDNDKERALSLVNIVDFIAKVTKGNVRISEDEVLYKKTKVHGYLADRIIDLMRNNENLDSIVNFTEKLMSNPNSEVHTDLYKWLENGNMPIYPDGDFAAYKVVNSDFTSIHKGPYGRVQSPGSIVEMPREECNANRNETCSTGLHFCSYDYLGQYSSTGKAIILLKINPADVVSIPTDYNLTKGRACKYYVVECINKEVINTEIKASPVIKEKPKSDATMIGGGKYPLFEVSYILKLLETTSASKLAEKLGVPRSTFADWIKKIK